jgi:hypothetical protein
MEHVMRKRGKAGHGGLGVAAPQAWRRRWQRPASVDVGDKVVGRLGRAGYEARWAGVMGWWARWLGPAGRPWPKEWAGRLSWKRKEEGNPLKIDF